MQKQQKKEPKNTEPFFNALRILFTKTLLDLETSPVGWKLLMFVAQRTIFLGKYEDQILPSEFLHGGNTTYPTLPPVAKRTAVYEARVDLLARNVIIVNNDRYRLNLPGLWDTCWKPWITERPPSALKFKKLYEQGLPVAFKKLRALWEEEGIICPRPSIKLQSIAPGGLEMQVEVGREKSKRKNKIPVSPKATLSYFYDYCREQELRPYYLPEQLNPMQVGMMKNWLKESEENNAEKIRNIVDYWWEVAKCRGWEYAEYPGFSFYYAHRKEFDTTLQIISREGVQ